MRFHKRPKGEYGALIGWPKLDNATSFQMFHLAWKELGQSLMYMDYMHNRCASGEKLSWEPQRSRVIKLCERFGKEEMQRRHPDTKKNRLWWRQLLSDIADEIENQC